MIGQQHTVMEEITHHTEDIQTVGRTSGIYCRVYLPDKIKDLGLDRGDYLVIEEVGEEPAYLRLVKAEDGEETSLTSRQEVRKIFTQGSSRLRVQIPQRWSSHYIDLNEETEEAENTLVVEVNHLDYPQHLRIYRNEDYYAHRIPELAKTEARQPLSGKPVAIPLLTGLVNRLRGYTDISKSTPYPGHKFEIIPFDGSNNTVVEQSDNSTDPKIVVDSDLLEVLKQKNLVPRIEVEKLTIEWCSEQEIVFSEADSNTIFVTQNTRRSKVILPQKGVFRFTAITEEGEGSTYCKITDEGEWSGQYIEQATTNNPLKVYIPVSENSGKSNDYGVSVVWDNDVFILKS